MIQCGRGYAVPLGDLSDVYRASFGVQKGGGLGSFLGNLFRQIRPLFAGVAKKLGRAALTTGSHILSDLADKSPEEKVGSIVKRRVTEALRRNMTGSGLLLRTRRPHQLGHQHHDAAAAAFLKKKRRRAPAKKATKKKKTTTKKKRKRPNKKKKREKRDIFST